MKSQTILGYGLATIGSMFRFLKAGGSNHEKHPIVGLEALKDTKFIVSYKKMAPETG